MREHIIINNDRTVVIPASVYKVGNRFDHGVNKVIFDCPRYADEEQTIDLSTMKIYINYIRSDKEPLSSLAMKVTVDETDPTIMHFVWDITRSVTFVDGVLDCLVCIKKTNAEGVEEHHWNSDIFSKLFVGKGMENTETIAEENIDLITQLLLEVDTAKAEVSGVSEAINAVDEKIGSLENLTTEDKSNVVDAVNEVKEASDNVAESVDGLKSDLSNKITKFYASNHGETHITDSDNGKIQDMMIYGKSSQDGTPTPESPVEINSVVNHTVRVTNEDGLKVQSVTLNNITLNAIPVSKGGNVTINGQRYIADYVDVDRGKVVRNILKWRIADFKKSFNNIVWHMNISELGIDGSKLGLSNMFKIQNNSYGGVKTSELYIANDGKSASLNMRGMTDEDFKKWLREKNPEVYNVLKVAEEIPINQEQITALKELATYYPTTNIIVNSEQLDGYTVFNYPVSMANGWNYVKQQLNDNRDYIYDIDTQSAESYVNSEYAVTLTELEV